MIALGCRVIEGSCSRVKFEKDGVIVTFHRPLLMVLGNAAQMIPELMAEAQTVRDQIKDLPERVIRREVRDRLDRARASIGPIANLAMDEVDEVVQRWSEISTIRPAREAWQAGDP